MKIAELLLQTLEANGVRHIFGNPGTTEIPLVRLCERRRKLKPELQGLSGGAIRDLRLAAPWLAWRGRCVRGSRLNSPRAISTWNGRARKLLTARASGPRAE